MLDRGKDPARKQGYAIATVNMRAYRLDRFYRMVWTAEQHYTEDITVDHADAWMEWLADQDLSTSYKASCQKAAATLFNWKSWKTDGKITWEPVIRFTTSSAYNPKDILTRSERRQIREAVLGYGSVPNYTSVTPAERDKWKAYLAQRFGKPKHEITPDDWEKANSWKIPSLLWTALDAGLRPKEVGTAKVSWLDTENTALRIPKEDSVKNTDNWHVSLLPKTVFFLERWLKERERREKYDNSDLLWLTRHGNPYGSKSLNRIFRDICEEAGIDIPNRDLTWYSIRHSVGTYMTREEDLKAAAAQLRHKSLRSTVRYDQAPVEDRRDALERMG